MPTRVIRPYGGKPTKALLPQVTAQLPRDRWPLWAKGIALKQSPEDSGVGDTVARTIGPFGGDAFKKWYRLLFGTTCGCERRQAEWNAKYSYVLPSSPKPE